MKTGENLAERDELTAWEKKAHEVIQREARAAWLQNKKKSGYRCSELSDALVKALGLHDAREREHEIKRLLEVDRLGALSLI